MAHHPDSSAGKGKRAGRAAIVDTDLKALGDDALALAFLLSDPSVRVLAITTTSGNQWADAVTRDTTVLLAELGTGGVAVHAGSRHRIGPTPAPPNSMLGRNFSGAFATDSREGAGGTSSPSGSAVPAVQALSRLASGPVPRPDLLLLGPATNLAAALASDPALPGRLGRVFILGGSLDPELQEFNFWFDAAAAQAVLAKVPDVVLVPGDLAVERQLSSGDLGRFEEGALAGFVRAVAEQRGTRSFAAWDLLLVACYATGLARARRRRATVTVTADGRTKLSAGGSVQVVTSVPPTMIESWLATLPVRSTS